MQRFSHLGKNTLVKDEHGEYVLYADVAREKSKMIDRHVAIMETAQEAIKLLQEQLQ